VRAFAFTVRACLVALVALPPLWLLLAFPGDAARTNRLIRRWARLLLRLGGLRLTVVGLERIPRDAGVILVANHSSILDTVALLAAVPRDFRMVVNHMAATRPLIGLIIRRARYIVVDRGSPRSQAQCARAMIDAVERGDSLLLYPEGTRNSGPLGEFHSGAFRTAARTGHPIVPIAISGTGYILPRKLQMVRRAPVVVTILPPIQSANADHLRDSARAAIALVIPSERSESRDLGSHA
jgi:fatty-acyl-CoA synthase